jgi:hypothetical protein
MNLTAKSETKRALFHSLGCDADDWLESAKKQAVACDGAKKALREAAKNVQGIAEVITKDMDEGKLAGLEALEVAKYAKDQVTRAVTALVSQSQHYENLQLAAAGEVSAFDKVVKHFTKLHDTEAMRIQQIREAVDSGEIQLEFGDDDEMISQTATPANGGHSRRPTGVRPAVGIAAQRKAEDAAKAPAKAAPKAKAPAKAQKVRKCSSCGKPGHTVRRCPEKK